MQILIILLILIYVHGIGYGNYFRVIDEVSFNLRDYNTSTSLYNNYIRDGNIILYKNYLLLSPRLNETHSVFYSPHVNYR